MNPEPIPTPSVYARADIFLAEFNGKYCEALVNARAAAETTATQAWRQIYRENMASVRRFEATCCATIADMTKAITDVGSTEDYEKAIKDSVKLICEGREAHEAWRRKAVDPYRIAAINCGELLLSATRAAAKVEEQAPLVEHGLGEACRTKLATWPKVAWDEENGAVTVSK